MEETIKALEETIKKLVKTNKEQAQTILDLQSVNKIQDKTIKDQAKIIENQHQNIEEHDQTIKKLTGSLSLNSRNSSKPPSSDGLNKSTSESLRPPSEKKTPPGGQVGHKGSYLTTMREADEFVDHEPTACYGCPNHDNCMNHACIGETRQVIDVIVTVKVTAHQSLVVNCPLHGKQQKGEFPADIKATVQYGENLQALTIAVNTIGAVSMKRTHEILGSVFNIPLSPGTVRNMVRRCAGKLAGVMETIRKETVASEVVHFDETGTRVDGKNMWVHVASNSKFTHLTIHENRGKKGMDAGKVLPEFKGIAVHDCLASYWKYNDATHAVCCAHLLRELIWVEQNYPEQTWATSFKEFLLEMKEEKENAIAKGQKSLSKDLLKKFEQQYDEIITRGYEENPPPISDGKKPGRPKKGKVLSLIERLDLRKPSVCLFITNFAVPFDNNQAERDIRMIKTKTKVSGCFRSKKGAEDYLTIMAYAGTAKKHKINPYEAIRLAVTGTPELIFA